MYFLDIPSRELRIHNTPQDIRSIFIEINLIKTIWLFCGCYDKFMLVWLFKR